MTQNDLPQSAKLDPESLAIRARPPRAIRFKRGVIIGIAAIGSVSLIAVTWMALKPRLFQHGENQQELSQPNLRPMSDGLSGAPATYGDVPRLGPPLPGDLGKPILERQQQLATGGDSGNQQLQQAEAAERERRLAELKAARESGVLVQNRQTSAPTEPIAATPVPAPAGEADKVALDPDRDPNAQGRKAAFVGKRDSTGDINPYALTPLPSLYTLSAGSVISASLITGLRSDLPGLVTAQVTENTYDSGSGSILLIP